MWGLKGYLIVYGIIELTDNVMIILAWSVLLHCKWLTYSLAQKSILGNLILLSVTVRGSFFIGIKMLAWRPFPKDLIFIGTPSV